MKHRIALSPPIAQQVAGQLAEAAGVDPRSLDKNHLQWVVEARCRALKLDHAAGYATHLSTSPQELDALIDAVVVQETRFFRDPVVFEHLRRWVSQLASEFSGELRILSAPCSTGQEAYSLAATLQLAGIPLERFTIDAFDISATALAMAQHGVFPEQALRRLTPEMQQACGTFTQGHWKMHTALRRRIRFARLNLAQTDALADKEPYHLILCRNLFIYLRAEARTALARSLAAVLMPGGRLVLGSADRVEEISELFSPLKPAAAFAFTHRQAVAAPAGVKPSATPRPRPSVAVSSLHRPAPMATSAPEPSLTTATGLYSRALEHQQRGELRRAERRCRQALYLDPKFMPALELLEKLWSHHPDIRLRRALEARILRHRVGAENVGIPGSARMESA